MNLRVAATAMALIIGLAGLPAGQAQPSGPTAPPAAAEQRLAHISIVELGQGEPVVLIPGLATPRGVWDGIAPELARTHRVILVQVNGFGGDDPGDNGQPGVLAGIVADLDAYLGRRGIEGAAVIGHSLGGLTGLKLARDHPNRVGRLLVVDALPFFGMMMGPGATAETVRPVAEQMRTMILAGPQTDQAPPNMSNHEEGRRQVAAWTRAANRAATAQALYEDVVLDLRPDLPRMEGNRVTILYAVPSAALRPMADQLYGEGYRGLAGARLVPVPDSAHFIMLDQPARFRALVGEFLSRGE